LNAEPLVVSDEADPAPMRFRWPDELANRIEHDRELPPF
jgi:hypothetical protein